MKADLESNKILQHLSEHEENLPLKSMPRRLNLINKKKEFNQKIDFENVFNWFFDG